MSKEAMKLALEALENAWLDASMGKGDVARHTEAITVLREALVEQAAQPQQEPVAWALYQRGRLHSFWLDKGDAYDFEFTPDHQWKPLYTSPPTLSLAQRQSRSDVKPLTVTEVEQILAQHNYELHGDRARYIVRMTEAAHGIKENT